MKLFVLAILPFIFSPQPVNFSEFDRILKRYVDDKGLVNYQGILEHEKKTNDLPTG